MNIQVKPELLRYSELHQAVNTLFALPVQDVVHISLKNNMVTVAIDGRGSTHIGLSNPELCLDGINKLIKDLSDFWLIGGIQ